GLSTLLIEGAATVGGGMRTKQLTLPGFQHDVCSAVHPMALDSAFFRGLDLEQYGLEWIFPPVCLAHPQVEGSGGFLFRSIAETAASLGIDGKAYQELMNPLLEDWEKIKQGVFGPLRFPRHPLALARFGLSARRSARHLALARFKGEAARALFGGISAHSILSLDKSPSAAAGLLLALCAHAVGWPVPRGGAQAIADAMAACFKELGGEIITGWQVETLAELPSSRVTLCDLTPRQLMRLAGDRLPASYRRRLGRYRYGPGVFKADYALSGPVPWKNPLCGAASTVHLGGTLAEITRSEAVVAAGHTSEKPFVLVTQPALFDNSRAPEGYQTLWAYCHVPHGSTENMLARIEGQLERFAPGFKELILARHVMNTGQMEQYNPNYVGGDINGGIQDWGQLFTRPVVSLNPYATPVEGLYLCSSSTPPGGGVHGMCGYWAARSALAKLGISHSFKDQLSGKARLSSYAG
ncbi:MAG TPA: NAD(P)/FAD-dependent oxidoreductase, partial [Chloroflexia bacterium]|nr:NAD(P)/FAD-dependent oxidoreductase [Chloroflexia bacterium]